MSIDLAQDELLTLSQACRLLPRRPSPATLWRWRTAGLLVKGRRIKLECVKAGGAWCTTRAAFSEFLRRQTDAALSRPTTDSDSPSERSESTKRRLDSVGLGVD